MRNQLTRGEKRRVMYVESKDGHIDGAGGRIGWVTFSKTGLSVRYRGRTLRRAKGGGTRGNYFDPVTGDEYWVSGIKGRGTDRHPDESTTVRVDHDAMSEYRRLKTAR
jgi:hypothetical protein